MGQGGPGRSLILAHPLKSLQRSRMRAGRMAREGAAPRAHECPGILQLPPSILQRQPLHALLRDHAQVPHFCLQKVLHLRTSWLKASCKQACSSPRRV